MEKTVLLVDRAIMMRKMIAGVLEKAGYKVVGECDSVARAMQLMAELSPDLVMTEVLLKESETDPGVTGITMTADILRQHPGAAVVICSTWNEPPAYIREDARKAGVKAILCKTDFNPSKPQKALAALEEALNA